MSARPCASSSKPRVAPPRNSGGSVLGPEDIGEERAPSRAHITLQRCLRPRGAPGTGWLAGAPASRYRLAGVFRVSPLDLSSLRFSPPGIRRADRLKPGAGTVPAAAAASAPGPAPPEHRHGARCAPPARYKSVRFPAVARFEPYPHPHGRVLFAPALPASRRTIKPFPFRFSSRATVTPSTQIGSESFPRLCNKQDCTKMIIPRTGCIRAPVCSDRMRAGFAVARATRKRPECPFVPRLVLLPFSCSARAGGAHRCLPAAWNAIPL